MKRSFGSLSQNLMTRDDSRSTFLHPEVPAASIDSTPAGILFLATGATGLLSTLFLVVFFAGVPVFGPLNDAFIGVSALLSAVVAWQLVLSRTDSVGLPEWLAPVVATVGALVVALGSVFVMTQITGYMLAGFYMALGNGIIGVWLLGLILVSPVAGTMSSGLRTLGIIAGAFMLLELICIIPMVQGSDEWNSVPRYVLYTAGVGAVGWIGLYPIWCILTALRLLRS
jgi:MFS family permease